MGEEGIGSLGSLANTVSLLGRDYRSRSLEALTTDLDVYSGQKEKANASLSSVQHPRPFVIGFGDVAGNVLAPGLTDVFGVVQVELAIGDGPGQRFALGGGVL